MDIELNEKRYKPSEVPDECPVCGCPEFVRRQDNQCKPPVVFLCQNCNFA